MNMFSISTFKPPHLSLVLFCSLLLASGCDAPSDTPGKGKAPDSPVAEKPFYNTGDKFRSLSVSHVDGQGKNDNWLIKNQCYFQYEHQVAWETEILSVSEKSIDAEFYITLSQQTLLQSSSKFAFRGIDNPAFLATWAVLDKTIPGPHFKAVSKTGKAIVLAAKQVELVVNMIPEEVKAEASNGVMKLTGVKLSPDQEPPFLKAMSMGISGCRVRVQYDHDLTFKKMIKVLDSGVENFSEEELTSFFKNADWLLHHAIKKTEKLDSGDKIKHPIGDGGSIFAIDFNGSARGYITISSQEDDVSLAVHGGRVNVRALTSSGEERGTLNPSAGMIVVDKENRFIKEANIRWDGQVDWIDEKHLMFGTKAIRNANVITKYETQRISE